MSSNRPTVKLVTSSPPVVASAGSPAYMPLPFGVAQLSAAPSPLVSPAVSSPLASPAAWSPLGTSANSALETTSPIEYQDVPSYDEKDPSVNVHLGPSTRRSISIAHSRREAHFFSADIVRDIIIGLSDGLTVPFALAAGLASLDNSRLVVTAGFAEIVAGSISMGLGGFLAGLSEIEYYKSERAREAIEIETVPHRGREDIVEIFQPYGISREAIEPLLDTLTRNKEVWVDFMMKFEHNLEEPDENRSLISALTIGTSYFCGGLVPLIPYVLIQHASKALTVSIFTTIVALFIFGFVKARLLGLAYPLYSAVQMTIVGAAAAGAAFGIAKLTS